MSLLIPWAWEVWKFLPSLMQQFSELDLEDSNGGRERSPNNSPPGSYNMMFVSPGPLQLGAIAATSVDNGTVQGLHSAVRAPISPFGETTNHGISSSVPQNMSSPVRVASLGSHKNLAGHGELGHSLGQVKFGLQGMLHLFIFFSSSGSDSSEYKVEADRTGLLCLGSIPFTTNYKGDRAKHLTT